MGFGTLCQPQRGHAIHTKLFFLLRGSDRWRNTETLTCSHMSDDDPGNSNRGKERVERWQIQLCDLRNVKRQITGLDHLGLPREVEDLLLHDRPNLVAKQITLLLRVHGGSVASGLCTGCSGRYVIVVPCGCNKRGCETLRQNSIPFLEEGKVLHVTKTYIHGALGFCL